MSEGKGILIGFTETRTANRDFKVFLEDNNLMQKADIRKEEEGYSDVKGTPEYYDNSNGSLYLIGHKMGLNQWEQDILKRVVRCRKKGNFKEDLEKTKVLIDLYLKEFE